MRDDRKARSRGPFFLQRRSSPAPTRTEPEAPTWTESKSHVDHRAGTPVIARAPIDRAWPPVISWRPVRATWRPVRATRAPISTTRAPIGTARPPIGATWAPVSAAWAPMAMTPMPTRRELGGLGNLSADVRAGRARSGFSLCRHRQHHRASCCHCQEKLVHRHLPMVELMTDFDKRTGARRVSAPRRRWYTKA